MSHRFACRTEVIFVIFAKGRKSSRAISTQLGIIAELENDLAALRVGCNFYYGMMPSHF
jgi:hypothetical protein